MKKLFSIENKGLFCVEKENSVYSIFDTDSNSHSFFDVSGKEIPNYKRPHINIEHSNSEYNLKTHDEELVFNKYGVACAGGCLVDKDGNEILDTKLNLEDSCSADDRYFTFSLITKEQSDSIDRCGTALGITVDVFDTKTRKYILRNIPECKLNVSFFDGEPEVILAAFDLFSEFDAIDICEKGTILGKKGDSITVFNYYD